MYALSLLLILNYPESAPCRVQAAFQVQKAFKSSLHFYFLRLRSPGSSISAHFMILATSIGFSS